MPTTPRSDLHCLDPAGTFEPEHDGTRPFRWTRRSFRIDVPPGDHGFATVELASPSDDRLLTWRHGGETGETALAEGWQRIDLAVRPGEPFHAEVNREFHPTGDGRALGIMVGRIDFHADPHRHRVIAGRQANLVANHAEYLSGSEVVATVPPMLRITTETACNIANETPCVYCSWDWAKRLEAAGPEYTPELLDRMGRFVVQADQVTDCGYGEPPLGRQFEAYLDRLSDETRSFEFVSNGQTLAARIRRRLLGRNVRVIVSIDSATADGYRRYRDHRFDLVIANLEALCAEKRAHGNLPVVSVAFIVMRSNRHEIDAFLALMKRVGVDTVSFRALYLEDFLDQRIYDRDGDRFDYDEEVLDADELHLIEPRIRESARTHGVDVTIEWEAFVINHAAGADDGRPLCSEPWKAAYLLNRGIFPCCYGREPFVSWSDVDMSDPETGVAEALNAEPFRALRRDLAAGRLGDYCRSTTGCPIVKAMKE